MTCPLCQTETPFSTESLQTGESVTCPRCGQRWTAKRLETVVSYASYVAAHPPVAAGRR
jgi:DNA-directed RNA polymerase subunit RPC12/RpoP